MAILEMYHKFVKDEMVVFTKLTVPKLIALIIQDSLEPELDEIAARLAEGDKVEIRIHLTQE